MVLAKIKLIFKNLLEVVQEKVTRLKERNLDEWEFLQCEYNGCFLMW